MKKVILTIALLASTSSFAITAPKGEYTSIVCKSQNARNKFSVRVVGNSENNKIKMVLEASYQQPITYSNVRVKRSQAVGGPTVYWASTNSGRVSLTWNPTTAPNPKGRKGTFSSVVTGRATNTDMLCNRIMY